MNSTEDLRIEPEISAEITKKLHLLESERLTKIKNQKTAWLIFGGITILVLAVVMLTKIFPILFAIVIAAIGAFIYQQASIGKFSGEFKTRIIQTLFNSNPEVSYQTHNHISVQEFDASNLFNRRIDRFSGEDLFEGIYGKTKFRFSEIKAEEKHTTTDSKGNTRTSWVTIFDGIFLIADFNKHLSFETRVFRKNDSFFNAIFKNKTQVSLESVEFEKMFNTYSNDQVEARYILSPAMMKRMLELQKVLDSNVHFCFRGNHVFIAVSTYHNFFEPNIKEPINQKQITRIFKEINHCLSIIEILDLNTRIWTKE